MFIKGKKTKVGVAIVEYCRKNGLTIGDFCIRFGIPTHRVDSVIYGRQVKVLPDVAEKFSIAGFDLGEEFIIAPRKTAKRLVIYPDRLSNEQLNEIYKIIGRR